MKDSPSTTPPSIAPEDEDLRMFSVERVAELFDVTPETVRSWIKKGKLPAKKIGRDWRIRRPDVKAFGEAQFGVPS